MEGRLAGLLPGETSLESGFHSDASGSALASCKSTGFEPRSTPMSRLSMSLPDVEVSVSASDGGVTGGVRTMDGRTLVD